MNIWAHRGCSQMYPENTLLSFGKAAEIVGLTGIELDIQLTRDGHIVVFHDESIDRTTNGSGRLNSYSLSELKKFKIDSGYGNYERIPTITEVFDLLEKRLKDGLKLNVELKNNKIPYEGMEDKIIDLVYKRGLENSVIYSSFNALSIERIKKIDPEAETAILDVKVSDCLYKLKGGCGADALHPFWRGIDLPIERIKDYKVRAWFTGHLYPEKPTGTRLDLTALENQGITDVFLNEPERYC
jgi:glycerophosphoryl diester phosphodiesterase